jgi:hypothetical protein
MKKLALSLVAVILIAAGSVSAQEDPNSRALHHFYELEKDAFHLYTANPGEAGLLKKKDSGWKYVGITGYILSEKTDETAPLYRLYKNEFGGTNHFFTISKDEANAAAKQGWKEMPIAGYVAKKKIPGTRALWHLYLPCTGPVSEDLSTKTCTGGDVHYYTADESERQAAIGMGMKPYPATFFIWKDPVPMKVAFPDSGLDAQRAAERKAMIYKNYAIVFGREPTAGDFKYWDYKAKVEKTTDAGIFNELRGFLNGNGNAQTNELIGTIQRAFAAAGKTYSRSKLGYWMDQSRTKQHWFVMLQQEIKNSN